MSDIESRDSEARALIAAIEQAMQPATAYRDDSPLPVVGPTPPVPQPGRPPMSQAATDASALMLSGSVLTLAIGGTGSLVMYASGYADPVVCAIVFGAPAAIALALARLMKHAKAAAAALPAETHHHYNGTVVQHTQTVQSSSRWLGKTTNNL